MLEIGQYLILKKKSNQPAHMDTNALLSIAFAIVTNFANILELPPQSVPQSKSDLEAYRIGSGPYSPTDVYLRHKSGSEFWIRNGVVRTFETPDSFFNLQDTRLIPKFVGSSQMTTNEVLDLATDTMRQ